MKQLPHTTIVRRKRSLAHELKRKARRALPFLAALFLATPLASTIAASHPHGQATVARLAPLSSAPSVMFQLKLHERYEALGAYQQGLRFEVFAKAMTGYLNMRREGHLAGDKQRLTVIDFDLPSTEKRLWVLDLATNQILFHTLVAHGHNTGENEAASFSNTNQSNMSSLGFYVTGTEYEGKHGHSLHLNGLDNGWNNNAAARSIVMHGADYVSEAFIKQTGRLGRSLGCPALPMDQYSQIIDAVTGGTCLFLNKSNAGYKSRFLNEEGATAMLVPKGGRAS